MAEDRTGREQSNPSLAGILAVPVAAGAIYGLVEGLRSGDCLLAAVSGGTRQALFVALTGTTSALLGFAIAGVTIIVTLSGGRRVAWLNRQPAYRNQVQFLFQGAIISLALATVVFLFLIIVGSDKDGIWIGWGILGAVAFAAVVDRMARLVWFLGKLMPIAMQDAQDEGQKGPNPPFKEPTS